MIVDCQVHLWNANTPERTSSTWTDHQMEPLTQERLLAHMDAAGVDRMVLIPPSWLTGGNEQALAATRAHPDRFAVMGRWPANQPQTADQLKAWALQPGMKGLRFVMTYERAHVLTDGSTDWLWPAAEHAGVPLMIHAAGALSKIDAIAERYPGLRIIIDHMGLNARGALDDAAFASLPDLLAIARRPNIGVKISCLPYYSTQPYPFANLHQPIRRTYDAFGPKRLFWGSDLSRLTCPYRQCVTLFTEELPWLSAEDREWIMGRALCRWLDWPAESEAPDEVA